ncbi:MAG: glycosyltransferase family 4 protein [Thermoanaerobaculia bacterium]
MKNPEAIGRPARTGPKVLAILEAGSWIPSGVVRGLQYARWFEAEGFDVEFVSRQPIETIDYLENPRPALLRWVLWRQRVRSAIVERATAAREAEIFEKAAKSDVVYLVKVTALGFIERLRAATRARIVMDVVDAVWLDDDRRGEEEFRRTLSIVDAVTTDNALTAAYVRACNPECYVVPDTPPLDVFDSRRGSVVRPSSDIVIGWIGTASTLYNLYEIWEALEIIGRRNPKVSLRLVGTGYDRALRPPFERIRYSILPTYDQHTMVDEILTMDIGLFPLQRVERCEVRGVLKAALYMSGEAAVVASPVGQVPEVIRHGQNGMLASSREEWVDHLQTLIDDEPLRRQLAENALTTVRERFTTERGWAILRSVLMGDAGASRQASPFESP